MSNKFVFNQLIKDIACEYWLKMLGGHVTHDNGDYSRNNELAMIMADLCASKNKPTQEQLDIFKKEFHIELDKEIEKYGSLGRVDLYCDYGPGLVLHNAAEKAGIDDFCFPFKMGIFLQSNAIIESKPYARLGTKQRIIYCTRDYIEQRIKRSEEELVRYQDPNHKVFGDRDSIIQDIKDEIKIYKDILANMGDEYVRDDFKDFVRNYKLNLK